MVAMASRWLPEGRVRVRNTGGWLFVVLVGLVAVPVAVTTLLDPGPLTAAIVVTALTAVVLAHQYFVSPQVVVTEEEILVENPWRRHVVPWGSLIDVDTRFNLTLVTPAVRVSAFGAPSPGGFSAMRSKGDRDAATRRALRQQAGQLRAGDLPSNRSGALAAVIRGHWRDRVETGDLDTSEAVTTTPRRGALMVTGGLLSLTALLWLLA